MNTTFKIIQKSDFTKKDGTRNIFLRFTLNRKTKYFPLNVYVMPKHFKNDNVLHADPEYYKKNLLIKHALIKADKIDFDYKVNDKKLTFEAFDRDFNNRNYGSKSFYTFVDQQIVKLQGKLAPGTLKNYIDQVNKLKCFYPDLSFNDIDLNFIKRYERFLIKERKNNKNTCIKSLIFVKSILNKAIQEDLIKDNVFKNFPLPRITGDREFLSITELTRLENLYYNNELKTNKANVLRYFLFSCYTGLRYQDVKNLKFSDVKDNYFISLRMGKTKEIVTIPLIAQAEKLLPAKGFDNQNVFKVLTDQPTNRYLKEIMKAVGIKKQISFHCARHTFATVSKSLGMDYDVISKLLGHTDIKTTKIYTKYELEYLTKEMERWNK